MDSGLKGPGLPPQIHHPIAREHLLYTCSGRLLNLSMPQFFNYTEIESMPIVRVTELTYKAIKTVSDA